MTPKEAAALLAVAAAFDNRKPDADAATAWSLALDGLRFEDCREVIVQHYRNSRDWLMPSDVNQGVRRLRGERVKRAEPVPPPPASVDPDDPIAYTRYLIDYRQAAADGNLEHFETGTPAVHGGRTVDVAELMPRPPTHAEVATARRAIHAARETLCTHRLPAESCQLCADAERRTTATAPPAAVTQAKAAKAAGEVGS